MMKSETASAVFFSSRKPVLKLRFSVLKWKFSGAPRFRDFSLKVQFFH